MSKPLMIWQGQLSGTWYATKSYRDRENGGFVCTGGKEDVTEQVNAAIAAATPHIRRAVIEELVQEVEKPTVATRDMISRDQARREFADWIRSHLERKP